MASTSNFSKKVVNKHQHCIRVMKEFSRNGYRNNPVDHRYRIVTNILGWHHYQSQNLPLCQNCSLIITPQTKQCSQKLTAEPPLGGEMPRTSQGHLAERCKNASCGHQTANCHTEPPIRTARLPNGLFNETIKCKWDLSCDS